MSGLRKNISYSILLTLSTYLVPLVVFPYISRVLGPEGIGTIDSVEYVINYAVVCSMMGLTTLGVREIARYKDDPQKLKETFSGLFYLNLISTACVVVALSVLVLAVPQFYEKKEMFFIGLFKIVANMFWIEWFFKGIENFKYITIRSLILRTLFVLAVFCFVTTQEDSHIYYAIWVGLTCMNAVCNWLYRRNYTHLSVSNVKLKPFIKPFILLGLFGFLSAVYTQLNVTYLSFVASEEQVGYYTTATRLYGVIIALFSTITAVMIPRMSILLKEQRDEEMKNLVNKTFALLFCFAFPVVAFMEIFAADIIMLFAGEAFLPAVLPMRIVMLQLFIIGTEQIFLLQVLIPGQKENDMLKCVAMGIVACAAINFLLVEQYQSIGSALAWVCAELAVFCGAAYYVKKHYGILFPIKLFGTCLVWSLPFWGIGWAVTTSIDSLFVKLTVAGVLFSSYALVMTHRFLGLGLDKIIDKIRRKK